MQSTTQNTTQNEEIRETEREREAEKKPSADSEIFSDEKDLGNNLAPVSQEEKKEKSCAKKRKQIYTPHSGRDKRLRGTEGLHLFR